ncbi:MAG: DUF4234 domain-containing protein [Clostridia bacterium]|nr:DUF4234 domain-containing protein [Clostridia bacterium]
MKIKNRNIVVSLILSIVTCGIYSIYWVICMAREAVSVKEDGDDGILEIILMIFLPFLGFFFAEKKLFEGCQKKGIPHTDNSIIYLILGLVGLGIVNFCLLQNDLNKLANE